MSDAGDAGSIVEEAQRSRLCDSAAHATRRCTRVDPLGDRICNRWDARRAGRAPGTSAGVATAPALRPATGPRKGPRQGSAGLSGSAAPSCCSRSRLPVYRPDPRIDRALPTPAPLCDRPGEQAASVDRDTHPRSIGIDRGHVDRDLHKRRRSVGIDWSDERGVSVGPSVDLTAMPLFAVKSLLRDTQSPLRGNPYEVVGIYGLLVAVCRQKTSCSVLGAGNLEDLDFVVSLAKGAFGNNGSPGSVATAHGKAE